MIWTAIEHVIFVGVFLYAVYLLWGASYTGWIWLLVLAILAYSHMVPTHYRDISKQEYAFLLSYVERAPFHPSSRTIIAKIKDGKIVSRRIFIETISDLSSYIKLKELAEEHPYFAIDSGLAAYIDSGDYELDDEDEYLSEFKRYQNRLWLKENAL
ncbi:hypothetical protein [Vibrio chaetopteri]|uniref:Uncharacterized protein n=1 Tax=Vibrio chaetopteri TaxID=3016528 RepID=A0AAU8BRG9_9VIBR